MAEILISDRAIEPDQNEITALKAQYDLESTRLATANNNIASLNNIKSLINASAATAQEKTDIISAIDNDPIISDLFTAWGGEKTRAENSITAIKLNVQAVTDKVTGNAKATAAQKQEFTDINTTVQGA